MLIEEQGNGQLCLVNVVTDPIKGYLLGQQRLLESLRFMGWPGGWLLWEAEYPPGSPKHSNQPYGFKIHAIDEALRRGYTTILWTDSYCWLDRRPAPLLEHLAETGSLLISGGGMLGEWCSDAVLEALEMRREEALTVPLVGGTVYGLDMENPATREFYRLWHDCYDRGLFEGYAINEINLSKVRRGLGDRPTGHVSDDPRVMGHKHDETCASWAAWKTGMTLDRLPAWFDGYRKECPVIVSQGM